MEKRDEYSTRVDQLKHRVAILLKGGVSRLRNLIWILQEAYGAPEAALGNRRDPLDEAIYILLTYQTNIARSKLVWRQLRSNFRRWEEVERATSSQVATVMRQGGLHQQKSRTIQALLKKVRSMFGALTLRSLRKESDERAERTLTQLPGLSLKGARCVLLYSLDRDAFPVDVNTFRIFKRIGIIAPDSIYRRKSLHDALQEAVPPSHRKRFHVNLVIHGKKTCLPRRPKCSSCAALSICKRVGLPKM
jgi:endonuclease-3